MSHACVFAHVLHRCVTVFRLGVWTCCRLCMFVQVGVRPGPQRLNDDLNSRAGPVLDWLGCSFPRGCRLNRSLCLSFFLSLSQMPPNILFLPLFKLFSPFLLPSSINKRLIWGKILKTLLTRRFDLVCVYFVEGCVGSGLELVTRQQQAWNSSSHRLLWQRGLCVCLGLGHNYHTNSHADTHCSFLT